MKKFYLVLAINLLLALTACNGGGGGGAGGGDSAPTAPAIAAPVISSTPTPTPAPTATPTPAPSTSPTPTPTPSPTPIATATLNGYTCSAYASGVVNCNGDVNISPNWNDLSDSFPAGSMANTEVAIAGHIACVYMPNYDPANSGNPYNGSVWCWDQLTTGTYRTPEELSIAELFPNSRNPLFGITSISFVNLSTIAAPSQLCIRLDYTQHGNNFNQSVCGTEIEFANNGYGYGIQ